jgi:HK97 family phage major capsid protein
VLDHSSKSIRANRLEDGAPLLLEHDPEKHIGVIESVSIGDDRVARASVRFGNSALAQETFQDVQDGVKRHISVGYVIHEVRKETQDDREIYRATDWEPLEISWVSIPADHSVGLGRSQTLSNSEVVQEATITIMSDSDTPKVDVQDVRATEMARIKDIESLGQDHENVAMARKFINEGNSVDEFRSALLSNLQNRPTETAPANIGMDRKELERYSLTKVIRHLADPSNARLRDEAAFELEASEAAANATGRAARGVIVPFDILSKRQIDTSSTTNGGFLVPEDHLGSDFIGVLSSHSVVFPKTTKLTGLSGDVSIPKMTTGTTAAFVANEAAAVAESTPVFGQLALSPETCGTYTDVGRKLFRQADPSVDSLILNDIARSLAVKIDQTIINGAGSSGEPTGILNLSGGVNNISHGTDGGAETWALLTTYLGSIQADNAQSDGMCWVLNPSTIADFKTIEKASGTARFLIDDNGRADGHEVLASSNIPTNLTKGTGTALHGAIFGDFSSCVVGLWGGLDLQVDPYSLGTKGVIRLVGLQDLDLGFRHEQSFSIAKDIVV